MTLSTTTLTPTPVVVNNTNTTTTKSTNTMMAELFQRSLGIREDGRCYRHPDVPIMEEGASFLGTCHFCAMEKQKEIARDDTCTTMSNSFFWSSAASLSLTSSFRQPNGQHHGNGTTSSANSTSGTGAPAGSGGGEQPSATTSAAQSTSEEGASSDKQQQQKFFESIVARWIQIQDGNLQQSIALSTPLILHEMRKLEAKVNQQGEIIQQQQKTILLLRQTIETKHESTQELLQTILQTISKNRVGSPTAADQPLLGYERAAPSTRGVPARNNSKLSSKRRPSMSSARSACRSVDSGVKQPLTRHDSNRSFTLTELSKQGGKAGGGGGRAPKEFSASQPLAHTSPLPASDLKKLSASQHHLVQQAEIALDGSSNSFDRTDLPDLDAIFEDGMGSTICSTKKKRFQIPASYIARRTSRPMEIILESSERNGRGSERKLLPSSPEEMGMDMGASLKGNAKAFIENSPHLTNNNNSNSKSKGGSNNNNSPEAAGGAGGAGGGGPEKKKTKDEELEEVRLSCVTLDAASAASELSDSDTSGYSDEEEGTLDEDFYVGGGGGEDGSKQAPSWVDSLDDDEPNDYSIDDLQHVSRYKMIDMYGDRGTYTGTLGADNDPTGFGTMKYESGRFYKGEWKKGRWNGKGTLLNANGDSYQGDFVSDARHGRGVYRFTSGDVYEGDFYEDNRHGKGKFKFHNGSVYTGDFCMGSFEGQGRYDFEGGFYEGSWKRDEYYGKGKLQYKDGSNYTGKFKRGSAHGFGEERLADGTVRCGLWKRGEFLQECTEEECKRLESKSANSTSRGKNKNRTSQDV